MVDSSHCKLAEDEARRSPLALRRSGAMLAGILILVVLSGCAELGPHSRPTQEGKAEWAQQFPLGKDKAAADQHFEKRNNETGRWASAALSSELTNDGTRAVYRYYWVREPLHREEYIWFYDLTFVNEMLIKFEAVNPMTLSRQGSGGNTGMGFLCKDAIARGDQGGIRTHCN